MAKVEIYTKFGCPYCSRAKQLLGDKGVAYDETDVSMDSAKRQEMLGRANGRTTVPQIFIGGRHVGGSDDLAMLEQSGKLDAMLAGAEG
ncbi:MAG: grxC [Alphaproteobacteria bacterium]|nr:grxC [Alphaproteobacteria bacterium]MDB5722446.1 grxC [Alphaproteobacteria bacterium]